MDWITFISTMTSALAWPTVIGSVAYFYRAEIRHLLLRHEELKLGPMEAEMFEQRIREVKQLAIALPSRQPEAPSIDSGGTASGTEKAASIEQPTPALAAGAAIDDHLLARLPTPSDTSSPRLAILNVWVIVEDSLRSLAERNRLEAAATVVTMLLALEKMGLITRQERDLLRQMYELRYEAAIATLSFSEDAVLDYVVAVIHFLKDRTVRFSRSFNCASVSAIGCERALTSAQTLARTSETVRKKQ